MITRTVTPGIRSLKWVLAASLSFNDNWPGVKGNRLVFAISVNCKVIW